MGGGEHFARLLEVLRPGGGTMFIVEGYFDESGDLDEAPNIFCVSGYFVAPAIAQIMDEKWRAVLVDHGIPYFHMVDCAHEPPSGVFVGKSKDERSLIVRKLIALIKDHTVEGISILARATTYQGPRRDEPNLYSQCAATCAQAMQQFIYTHRIKGNIAYFFEAGHKNKGSAYNYLAEKVKRPEDSLTFACKTQVPLLQSADLLAWQSTKYAKDYFYQRQDGVSPTRAPRKDFQSLMEHPHTFLHLDVGAKEGAIGVEIWPMRLRNPSPDVIHSTLEFDGPIGYLRENDDPTPIIPIERTMGWRMGGARLAYVTFENVARKKFALALDEPRLFEMIIALLESTGLYEQSQIVPLFSADNVFVDENEDLIILRIKLRKGASLAFHLSPEVFTRLRTELFKK